jgi:hypothetical protein
MAKTTGIRKTIEILLKKVEVLEDQNFAQKLAIDELESKLEATDAKLKQVQENPFGSVSIPLINPVPMPMPPTVVPAVPGLYGPGGGIWGQGGGSGAGLYGPGGGSDAGICVQGHTCSASGADAYGNTYCVTCGAYMWSITHTGVSAPMYTATTSTSSTDVEEILDLDISWIVEDDQIK